MADPAVDLNAIIASVLANNQAGGSGGGVTVAPLAPPAPQPVVAAPQLQRPVIGQGPAPAVPAQPQMTRQPVVQAPAVPGHPQTAPAANTNTALSPDMAALLAGVPPDMRAAFAAKLANDEAVAKAITENQNQRSQLIQKMLDERPPVLSGIDHAFAAPPPAPDVQPVKAFQNFGVVLAMLGSLLTRRPLTAALKAGAAAMDAYNKGQYRDYAIQRQNWHDNVELAMKQNELEIQRYQAARTAYGDDMDKLSYAMQEIAAENKDTIALQQLKNGEMDDVIQLIQHRDDMAQRYRESNMRYRLGGRPLTAAQLLHDQKITEAQERLSSVYKIDYSDPNALQKLYQTINANGGFVDPQTREILNLYKLANEPTYQGMNTVPGLGGTEQPPPARGNRMPWPDKYANDPDGTVITQKSTGKRFQRQGNEAVEIDDGSAASSSPAPETPAAPAKSSWWPF